MAADKQLEVPRFVPAGNWLRDLADARADQERDDAAGNGADMRDRIERIQEAEHARKVAAHQRELEEALAARVERDRGIRELVERLARAKAAEAALGGQSVAEVVVSLLERVARLEAAASE